MAKTNLNTEKKRRQRVNIRKNDAHLAAYQEKDAKWKREARKKLKERPEEHPRLLAAHKLKKKLEMREYEKRKKEEKGEADNYEIQSRRSKAAKA